MQGKFLTLEQIRQIEELARKDHVDLMELAGEAVAKAVYDQFDSPVSVLVLIGSGNNGGDGVAAAIELLKRQCTVTVVQVTKQVNNTTANLLAQFRSLGGTVLTAVPADLFPYMVLIDAIFGIGLHGELSEVIVHAINMINQEHGKSLIIAVDTPSGLNPFSGEICSSVVRADITVTFLADKPFLHTGEAANYSGIVSVADLGTNVYYNQVNKNQAPQILFNRLDSMDYSSLIRIKNQLGNTFYLTQLT